MGKTAVREGNLAPVTEIDSVRVQLADLMPEPGVDRFWKVSHQPRNRANPMRVELRESIVPGRTNMSTLVGYENTVASAKAIAEAANLVLTRVGDYHRLVGEYGVEA